MFYCVFVTFPCGVIGQVWYLIVSIPDLCLLTYFEHYACLLYQPDTTLVSANELILWTLRRKQAGQARSQAEARKPGL